MRNSQSNGELISSEISTSDGKTMRSDTKEWMALTIAFIFSDSGLT